MLQHEEGAEEEAGQDEVVTGDGGDAEQQDS